MTDKLPQNLLALFTARPTLKYLVPRDVAPEDRRTTPITGVGAYVDMLREEAANGKYEPTESWLEKKDRTKLEKEEKQKQLMTEGFKAQYKPQEDSSIRGTGFETLFIARLNYKTEVKHLRDYFERFGRVARVRVVAGTGQNDPKHKGMSRGYAFVQFENESDMKAAYKASGDLVLHDHKVIVDVERGRTVSNWRPRRFGGGLGGRHYTKAPKPAYHDRYGGPPSGPGGYRGGFRGGFRGGYGRDRGGGRFGGGGGGGGRYGDDRGYRGGPPDGAPAGPRSGFGGGYGRDHGGRDGGNANYEPVQARGGYRDRDSHGSGGYRRHQMVLTTTAVTTCMPSWDATTIRATTSDCDHKNDPSHRDSLMPFGCASLQQVRRSTPQESSSGWLNARLHGRHRALQQQKIEENPTFLSFAASELRLCHLCYHSISSTTAGISCVQRHGYNKTVSANATVGRLLVGVRHRVFASASLGARHHNCLRRGCAGAVKADSPSLGDFTSTDADSKHLHLLCWSAPAEPPATIVLSLECSLTRTVRCHGAPHHLNILRRPPYRSEGPVLALCSTLALVDAHALPQHKKRSDANPYAPFPTSCPSERLIRPADSISPKEKAYVEGRNKKAQQALFDWLIKSWGCPYVEPEGLPKIAISLSGGGPKAGLTTAGVMYGLDGRDSDTAASGLLQAATYISALSGGSLTLSGVMANDFSKISTLKSGLYDASYQNPFAPAAGPPSVVIRDNVNNKTAAGYPASLPDVYGRAISFDFIASGPGGGDGLLWSNITTQPSFKNFDAPYPIITVSSTDVAANQCAPSPNGPLWELGPYEFGAWEDTVNAFFNTQYLGNSGTNGSCSAGFDNIGFFTGASSNILVQLGSNCSTGNYSDAQLNTLTKAVKAAVDTDALDNPWNIVPNPFYQSSDSGNISSQLNLYMGDGGFNGQGVPIFPWIQPERDIDVILVVDASSSGPTRIANGGSIYNTYAYAQRRGLSRMPIVPTVDQFAARNLSQRASFYGCYDEQVQTLIYFPNTNLTGIGSGEFFFSPDKINSAIQNGTDMVTQGNNTEWAGCLACGIMHKTPWQLPDFCESCLDQYCWQP